MRILYASERPPYPFFLGGAARCAHRLLLSLVQDQHASVLAVGSSAYRVSAWATPLAAEFEALGVRQTRVKTPCTQATGLACEQALDCGYPVQVVDDFPHALEGLIDEFKPDVIWSQLEGAHEVLSLAQRRGVVGLLYVHDAEDGASHLRAASALGCRIVCSSAFLARKVERLTQRRAAVIYPASDWHFGTRGDPTGFITMVNAHAVKGLETFLEIARRMPDQRFLLQESWKLGDTALAEVHDRLESLPNVLFQARVADMRAVYAKTRLLLVPSVWEEGFGMVAVEAQSCGIPVIASARGGLPESVGRGGLLVSDYKNPEAWLGAIRKLDSESPEYKRLSVRALANAQRDAFTPKFSGRRFIEICAGNGPSVSWRESSVIRSSFSLISRLRNRMGWHAR